MTNSQPNPDAAAVRGIVAAADWHVSIAQAAIADRVAAGASQFSDQQRDAARELAQLRHDATQLVGSDRSLSDDELADARARDLQARANRIVERADELRLLFDEDGPPEPPLDVALDRLVNAVLNVAEQLTVDADLDPDDLLWAAQRLTVALEGADGLFTELGDRAAALRDVLSADEGWPVMFGVIPAGERAYLAHLRKAPSRLYAAARALRLAARHGHLVELEAFWRPPRTRVRVGDAWIDVVLLDKTGRTYRVRVAGAPAGDPTAPGISDGELVHAIGAAAGLELGDVAQRRMARAAAEHARRALDAITAFRDSGQRGGPQDAARLASTADRSDSTLIEFSDRPDSTQDLVDVLLDLQAERWPVSMVLMDSLAAVCRALDDDAQAGIDCLLSYSNDNLVAAEHLRALVETWAAAALEHEAKRLRDPAALRYALLSAMLSLQQHGRPANTANLHVTATKQLVSRDDVDQALAALEGGGLLKRADPLARAIVWKLTAEGLVRISAHDEPGS